LATIERKITAACAGHVLFASLQPRRALFGTATPLVSTSLISLTGDKAAPGYWLMFAAGYSLVALPPLYRSGRAVAGRAAAQA
jgi:hypothetical protein